MNIKKKIYELGSKAYASMTGKEIASYEESQAQKTDLPPEKKPKEADTPLADPHVSEPESSPSSPASEGLNNNPEPPEGVGESKNLSKKKNKTPIIIGVGILLLAAFAGMLLFGEKTPPTLDVTNYISFSMAPNGRNGHGRIVMEMDGETFRNDLANLFCVVINGHDFEEIKKGINIAYSQEEGLSNGDVVSIDVTYDLSAVPSRYSNPDGYNIIGQSGSFTVEGLSDAEFVDPFSKELIDIRFSGSSGAATATIEMKSNAPYLAFMSYSVSPSKGLKNGDVVTVSIDPDVSRLSEMGYALPDSGKWTAEETVTGLNELVTDPSIIPANVINSMVQYSEAKLNENFNAIKRDDLDQVVIAPEISTIYFFDKVDKTSPYTNYFKNLEMVNGIFVLGHFFVQDVELQTPEGSEGMESNPVPTVVNTYGGYYVWIFPNVTLTTNGDFTYDRDMVCQWPTQNQTESDCLNWAKGEFTDFAVTSIGTNTN